MDTKTANQFFFEKKAFKVLRYVSFAMVGFGIFSCIFLWSGFEIGMPFLVVGLILLGVLSVKTVKGRDFEEWVNKLLSAEAEALEERMASEEDRNGTTVTSCRFVTDDSLPVKKAGSTVVSPRAVITVLYCSRKTNRLRVLISENDLLTGEKKSADISGALSDFSVRTEEQSYYKGGLSVKQLKCTLTAPDGTFELLLNNDFTTQKLFDECFTGKST